jgi:nucleotidyltransferase substrate binding protein (TIGR01987 family)
MDSKTPKQNLSHLEKAIASLDQLHTRISDEAFMATQDKVIRLSLQAGLIQNFEFTYELCWKAIKLWLENNVNPEAVDGVTRRKLFRLAAENRLVEDVEEWMIYNAARNQSSHQYDSALAEETISLMADFVRAAQRLLNNLKARND